MCGFLQLLPQTHPLFCFLLACGSTIKQSKLTDCWAPGSHRLPPPYPALRLQTCTTLPVVFWVTVLFVWLFGWFSTWGQWTELRPSHLGADVAIIRYSILGSSHTCPDIIVRVCVCGGEWSGNFCKLYWTCTWGPPPNNNLRASSQ